MISWDEAAVVAPAAEKSRMAINSARWRICRLSKYRKAVKRVKRVPKRMIILKKRANPSVLSEPLKASTGRLPKAQTPEQQRLPEQGKVKSASETPRKAIPFKALFLFSNSKKRSTNKTKIAVITSQISVKKAV